MEKFREVVPVLGRTSTLLTAASPRPSNHRSLRSAYIKHFCCQSAALRSAWAAWKAALTSSDNRSGQTDLTFCVTSFQGHGNWGTHAGRKDREHSAR